MQVAWLYNIRGTDVSYCPVVHAFAIVTSNSAFLYVDKKKVSAEANHYMEENGIDVRDYIAVSSDAVLLASDQLDSTSKVKGTLAKVTKTDTAMGDGITEAEGNNIDRIWIDSGSCCYTLFSKLNSEKVLMQQSPLALAKALKNPVELDGLKKAHIRDGAAVVQYLVWLDKQHPPKIFEPDAKSCLEHADAGVIWGFRVFLGGAKEAMKLTEVTVSDKLEGFRASKEKSSALSPVPRVFTWKLEINIFLIVVSVSFLIIVDGGRGLSFPTISSVGPNAAIIHYSPQAETCAELNPDNIYLFDSGAQLLNDVLFSFDIVYGMKYLDGTTDITRTVHFGKPSAHEKACYTAVLKGHIALGNACFPNGTNGHALDILARIPLWKDGLDYRHGTGHGIGSYLNVHEGPHLISFRPHARNVPLQASMTVTDEPGYYEDGNFGIRLENVLIVNKAGTKFNFGDKGYLSFEHITWAPYQTKLIDLSLLVPEEINWLNTYHARCRDILASHLDESEMAWLNKATEPSGHAIIGTPLTLLSRAELQPQCDKNPPNDGLFQDLSLWGLQWDI
ncbi:unnamed protein product [Dovyalis caffra]|uniref:Xaa-Pro aminopeptidase P n=1 Tax=Dovyalis caffra TaxID=77055 RepID=A0AAV1RT71_9ROSI|nr:unnamed protein product [Dovyalis caffra]